MDKNSLIGLFLIGAILIGFGVYNQPSDEEIATAKLRNDAITKVEKSNTSAPIADDVQEIKAIDTAANIVIDPQELATKDSIQKEQLTQNFGVFGAAVNAEEKEIKVETDLLRLTFSTRGGFLKTVELKDYMTYDSMPLILIDQTSKFGLNFFTKENINIVTEDLIFETNSKDFTISGDQEKTISFKLNAGNNQYLEYVYTIKGDNYLLGFDLNMVGLDQVLAPRTSEILLDWQVNTPNQEQSRKNQMAKNTVYFKYADQDIDYVSETKDEKISFDADLKWVSMKQQYFNSTLIANETAFGKYNAYAETNSYEDSSEYIKKLTTSLSIPYQGGDVDNFDMSLYLGPNKHDILESYNVGLEDIINLGWGIFGWVNKYAVIPVFDLLDSTSLSYGIIILILTLLLKLVLSPITYKTYMSSAKMRVLKPEIAEITKKHGDDAMKKQQATMALYRQTGVNPLAGCIPMLIQMPILIAMFRFFPASIELRQEPFLWATDLSTYDSIYQLPFTIPFYGDHVSLFTILMAISLAFYTKFNSSMSMGGAAKWPNGCSNENNDVFDASNDVVLFQQLPCRFKLLLFLGKRYFIRTDFINSKSIY